MWKKHHKIVFKFFQGTSSVVTQTVF